MLRSTSRVRAWEWLVFVVQHNILCIKCLDSVEHITIWRVPARVCVYYNNIVYTTQRSCSRDDEIICILHTPGLSCLFLPCLFRGHLFRLTPCVSTSHSLPVVSVVLQSSLKLLDVLFSFLSSQYFRPG